MNIPDTQIPIIEIPLKGNIQLFIKREDLIHPKFQETNIGSFYIISTTT